jgi:hypothetical protein
MFCIFELLQNVIAKYTGLYRPLRNIRKQILIPLEIIMKYM